MNLRTILPFPQALIFAVSLIAHCPRLVAGEDGSPGPPPESINLFQAIEYALENYPSVPAAMARSAAAGSGVKLAQTAYLPRTDLVWAANRATRNNVFGLLLPQSVIPSISGPVLGQTSYESAWGSAAGALFSWEPFDFGLRKATVDVSRAAHDQTEASLEVTKFDVVVRVTDAFLALIAGEQTVRAARASVERARVLTESVSVLVKNELKPGVDESRARAELALAQAELARAEEAEAISRATLAQTLGAAGRDVRIDSGPMLAKLPGNIPPASPADVHPAARAQTAALELVRARNKALQRSHYPRFSLQAAFSGRGTGAMTDGQFLGGAHGLWMDTPNWAVGLSVTFSVFDFASVKARKEMETQNESAESARYEEVVQSLRAEAARAKAQVEGARKVAEQTPIQLEAARATEMQARARYQAGLAPLLEVADAQRMLLRAEIEDSLARLRVWQAGFRQGASGGDLKTLRDQIRQLTGGF